MRRLSKRELELHIEESLALFNFLSLICNSCPLGS